MIGVTVVGGGDVGMIEVVLTVLEIVERTPGGVTKGGGFQLNETASKM